MRISNQWSPSFPSLFWSKISDVGSSGCWNWTASIVSPSKPYGRIRIRGRLKLAHRVAYELAHGEEVSPTLQVLHTCDNHSCCNPEHLKIGTNADNMHDKSVKGRINTNGGPQGKFTYDEWVEIRKLYSEGWTYTEIGNKFLSFDTTIKRVIQAGDSYRYKYRRLTNHV
jgi:HNH endonuclease